MATGSTKTRRKTTVFLKVLHNKNTVYLDGVSVVKQESIDQLKAAVLKVLAAHRRARKRCKDRQLDTSMAELQRTCMQWTIP